jgi:hypothetical protein
VRYEWHEEKRLSNVSKHGLDFVDAPEVFLGPVLTDTDTRFDYGEDRVVGVGFLRNIVVVIVFTEPTDDVRRVISLRKALTHERERFEAYLTDRLG